METLLAEEIKCHHCGDDCKDKGIHLEGDKHFCCEGCKTVYEILSQNGMCSYYDLSEKPGITLKGKNYGEKFSYLSNKEIEKSLLEYADDKLCKITLYVPAMHCSSCIWLLENLYKLRGGISYSRVNFLKKELSLSYNPGEISLQQMVELLATLGYEPLISLEDYGKKAKQKTDYSMILKIGVTAFCTGNVMLFSFPEYFGLDTILDNQYKQYFIWLNVLLSLPVFFYGGSVYLIAAYKSLKEKVLSLDVPISIGMITLFIRSLVETVMGIGPGYWDSLTGLILFLLLGKWIQNKTYESLSFERNYKSYFPLAVTVLKGDKQESVPVAQLKRNDLMLIRNQELIPADSILLSPAAWIDYSFVTGESEPVAKKRGDYLYAGGRQVGSTIELEVQKPVSQSYLTQLWNNEAFTKDKITPVTRLAAQFSRYFTYITLALAAVTAIAWYFIDPGVIWNAFTAVLIVACPCALSLSMPFTMGSTMSIFGRNKFYVKNPNVIQHLATISHIVFDKTGTLTQSKEAQVTYIGGSLTPEEKQLIKSLTAHSTHPLSRKIYGSIPEKEAFEPLLYKETEGEGIQATINGKLVKAGSAAFIGIDKQQAKEPLDARVYLSVNNQYKGYFSVESRYREALPELMAKLKRKFRLSLLSGDHAKDKHILEPAFGKDAVMKFEQSPAGKLAYIQELQEKGEKVLMIGD